MSILIALFIIAFWPHIISGLFLAFAFLVYPVIRGVERLNSLIEGQKLQ